MTNHKDVVTTHFDNYAGNWHERFKNHAFYLRYLAVKDFVINKESLGKIVDIGCGTGDYCQLFDTKDYLGIDISPKMIERCKNLYPNYLFEVADGDKLDIKDKSINTVLDVAVIEYYDDPLPHMFEINRILENEGNLIIAVPNGSNKTKAINTFYNNLINPLREILGKKSNKSNQKDPRVEHRSKTFHQMKELSNDSGFKIIQHSYVNILLFPVFHRFVGMINRRISSMISRKNSWKWLTKYSSTISVYEFKKIADTNQNKNTLS